MERRAPAPVAVGVDQFVDRRVEPGLRERLDDEAALPVAIARGVQCWVGQPPHTPKCGHNGLDALGARALDPQEMAAVRMAGNASTSTISPGSVYGTNTGPPGVSAMPSPRWPMREMVRRSVMRPARLQACGDAGR